MRWRVARRCWLSLPFFLGGEHVLGVAVVVGVALEAAAEAGGAVASATVGALGDVLVVGVGGGLGDNDGLVAGGVVHLVDGNVAVGGDGGSLGAEGTGGGTVVEEGDLVHDHGQLSVELGGRAEHELLAPLEVEAAAEVAVGLDLTAGVGVGPAVGHAVGAAAAELEVGGASESLGEGDATFARARGLGSSGLVPAAVHEEDGAGGEVVSVVDDLVDVEGDLGVVRGGVELGDAVHLGDVVLDGSGRGVGADLEGAEVVDELVGVGRAGSGVISGTSGEGGGARIGVGAGATTDGVGVGGISDAVGRARVDPGGATAEAVAGCGELGGPM